MKANENLHINLLEKTYYNDIEAEFLARGFKKSDENEELGLKTGDVIEFWGGMNNDIRYTSRILGFDSAGKAFMFWDCYWFPVDLTPTGNREHIKITQE